MDLSTFIWSVLASIVGTSLIGTVTFKIINRNKNINKINQQGNNNKAYMNSTSNINYEKGERNDR